MRGIARWIASALLVPVMLPACPCGSLAQPTHNRPTVANKHDGDAERGYSATNPLLPPIILAPVKVQTYSLQSAADQQAQGHDDNVKWTDIAIAFLTLVLAGCGIAGVLVAYFQWGALKAQVNKLEEAIAAEIKSGRDRASENALALAVARQGNEISREIGQAQTRAYVSVSNAGFKIKENGEPVASITIKNFGSTPSLNQRGWMQMWVEDFPLKIKLPEPEDQIMMSSGLVGRGSWQQSVHPRLTVLNDFEQREIRKGTAALYMYGRVTYEDVFGYTLQLDWILHCHGEEAFESRRFSPYIEGNTLKVVKTPEQK
jgi:hypothetical protein